jgi:3'(2'), 5'-bisphosphate nucleotidase
VNGDSLRLVASRSHGDPLIDQMQAALEINDVKICGSVGLKCALIAEGDRDLYVHPVPYLKEWDTCAPEIILREAGGTVTDCTGMPLRYNKAAPLQPRGILAAAPGVQGMVLPSLKSVFQQSKPQYVTA